MDFSNLKRQLAAFVTGDRDRYQYTLVPRDADRDKIQRRATTWYDRNISTVRLALCLVLCAVLISFSMSFMQSTSTPSCTGFTRDRHCRKEIAHSWGQYTSSFSVPSEISPSVPENCEVTFAQLLSRHGARYPTAHKSLAYGAIVDRIHDNVKDYGNHFKFIKDYKYTLGADQLTRYGENQMINAGLLFYERYKQLASSHLPFIRASGQNRVVVSAKNWTQGFHTARQADIDADPSDPYPYDILVIPEGTNFNNSLSPDLCPAFEEERYAVQDEQVTWREKFVSPIAERLNENLPGANLSDQEAIYMMDMCPFVTVTNDRGKLSEFCYLYTVEEWHNYNYYQSLGKWYGYGNGNPLGPTQGVGFVNELLARLTGEPVIDHTTTNSTLDGSKSTFPLNHHLYADFSHDNDMMDIFAALGLYNLTDPLPSGRRVGPHETFGFSASWVVPFASRLYVEKMTCGGEEEEFVRILVNDRVIPLQNCGADELGLCTLGRFVESQSFARNGGHWDMCFA
ncbi:phosphoglycerate mutase-like protein [Hypoxylon sp. NC1633]|nr:phosphoglycerate mutase-like protein [Hypoxylon sp. NC1633]